MLARLRDNFWLHLATLFAFALLLNREGPRVPGWNENVYLLYLIKAWNAGFLATDWTFQETTAGHPIFNLVFGWPTRFISVEAVAWIGRGVCWAMLFSALLRLGRHFRIAPWMVWLGLLLWLIERQAFVADEWIIGGFEAKCVAYICLLFALDFVLEGRLVLPAILTGLAFTFHSAVGLWGGAALGLAFATLNPIKTTLKFAAWAALFALPGIITTAGMVFGGHSIPPEAAKFLVTVEMPFNLDPLTFGKAKIAAALLMLLFNWLQFRSSPDGTKRKFLIRFELFAAGFFLLGIALRLAGQFSFVQMFPFRVFAVLILLFFFWHLAEAVGHFGCRMESLAPPVILSGAGTPAQSKDLVPNVGEPWETRRVSGIPASSFASGGYACAQDDKVPALLVFGIFLFLCLPGVVGRLAEMSAEQLPKWRQRPDDFALAAGWIRQHTAPDAVVIAPPWRVDGFYQLRRPLIANWHAPRYDAMIEWRQRIEALVGDVSQLDPKNNLAGEMDERARDFYEHLSEADLAAIQKNYGGDVLLTCAVYPYPLLFTAGQFKVYQLHK